MRYFDEGGRRAVWIVHRRGGKDTTMINQTAKMAMRRVGTYWHCLPTQRQGRKIVWDGINKAGLRMIDQAFPQEIRKGRINATEMKIELVNGSIFQVVGTDNFDNLVGTNPVGVTFSEWPLCRPSAWDYIRPILAENEGWASFIYTPRGKNHGYTLAQMAKRNPDWYYGYMPIDHTNALHPSVLDDERAAGMPEELIQQEYYLSFDAKNAGSIYGELVPNIDEEKDRYLPYTAPYRGVFTAWDLGRRDSTAIWFFTVSPKSTPDVIDYYECHNKDMEHYFKILESKDYHYSKHFLPHDGAHETLVARTSMMNQMLDYGMPVHVIPKLPLVSGLQAGKQVLKTARFTGKCRAGLEAIAQYQRKYDEDTRTYSDKPDHDWSSHGADAWRYLSLAWPIALSFSKGELMDLPPRLKPGQFTLNDCETSVAF